MLACHRFTITVLGPKTHVLSTHILAMCFGNKHISHDSFSSKVMGRDKMFNIC